MNNYKKYYIYIINFINKKIYFYAFQHKYIIILKPLLLRYTILYSNIRLLDKYNMTIPKTWDEMIITAKYIMQQEQLENNYIYGYNGYFPSNYKYILNNLYRFI